MVSLLISPVLYVEDNIILVEPTESVEHRIYHACVICLGESLWQLSLN